MNRHAMTLVATLVAGSLLTACSSGPSPAGSSAAASSNTGPVELTVWSWVADLQKEADVYNKANPGVKVTVVNAGNDAGEYEKVRNAIKAGSGVPDAFFTGAYAVPAFGSQDQLIDLDSLGAAQYKGKQVSSAWEAMSFNGKLYSMPAGIGPIVMYYRKDIFDKAGISVPKTWDEYALAAEKLKAANPSTQITSFPNDYNVFKGLVAQTGLQPWGSKGTNGVVVDFDNGESQKVATYWQNLLDKNLISTVPWATPDYIQAFAKGKLATLIGGAWLPLVMKPNMPDTAGKWAVAPLPQWTAGESKTGDAGLAGYSVPKGAPHPKEAADFIFWLTNSEESVKMLSELQSQFPSYLPMLESAEFLSQKDDFFGGQAVREVYANAAKGAVPQPNTPVQDYADPQLAQALGEVLVHKTTTQQVLTSIQEKVETFAKKQGYSVTR